MSRPAVLLLAWTAVAMGSYARPSTAAAQGTRPTTIVHRVSPGDSLALLAAEYYGDRRHQVIIAVENRLDEQQPLAPRGTLRIPVDQEVVTDAGDTLDDLAQRHLGDVRRARFLVGFSGNLPAELAADAPLAAGLVVRVPLHVRHMLAADEPLAAVADRYLGNPAKARLLREYNFLDDEAPAPGTELLVPVYHVSVHGPRRPALDEASRQRVARRAEMQPLALAALAGARAAWSAGDYAAVRRLLGELDTRYLDAGLAVEIDVLLGEAHVAFGDEALALAAFGQALARNPSHVLDPYEASPKIRAVWEQAGGTVGSAP